MFYRNSFYAQVGGVTLRQLNEMEEEFLELIGFRCHVDHDTYHAYLERLEMLAEGEAGREGEEERENTSETVENDGRDRKSKQNLPL